MLLIDYEKNKRSIYQTSERDEIRRKLASTSTIGEQNVNLKRNENHMSDYYRKSSSRPSANYLGN